MLLNLDKKNWSSGLVLQDFVEHRSDNEKAVKTMLALAEGYNKSVVEESVMTVDQLKTRHVGKQVYFTLTFRILSAIWKTVSKQP